MLNKILSIFKPKYFFKCHARIVPKGSPQAVYYEDITMLIAKPLLGDAAHMYEQAQFSAQEAVKTNAMRDGVVYDGDHHNVDITVKMLCRI